MERKNRIEINKHSPKTNGSEAQIFNIKEGIYKEFYPNTPIEILKRKEKKLLLLATKLSLKKYMPTITCIVDSFNNEFMCGYIMKPIEGQTYNTYLLSWQQKLEAIEILHKILNMFLQEGFFYMDIRIPNIRITKENIPILLDIDSIMQIEEPILDIIPTDLKIYLNNGGKINEQAQRFMFNRFTQSILFIQEENVDSIGRHILDELEHYPPNSYLDNEYLFKHIKKCK